VSKSHTFKAIRPGQHGVQRAKEIREFILERLAADEYRDVTLAAVERFGVSRQAINKQLWRLEEHGLIEGRGRTKAKEYRLNVNRFAEVIDVPGLQEYDLWKKFAEPHLLDLPDNVQHICHYGFTEMVNNVIDHAESSKVVVTIERSVRSVKMMVTDKGVGVFKKIQRAMNLPSEQEAIFELSKGKFTTDPTRHTGEGIFFTSRMFDDFRLLSGDLFLSHRRDGDDWLMGSEDDDENKRGTHVAMSIDPASTHTMDEIFQHYSAPREDFAFNRTNVVLRLLDTGADSFISRSQAKRVLARLPRFKEVMLDFEGVQSIGPAFADEIFRVFQLEHPDIRLYPLSVSDDVQRMIDRAKNLRDEANDATQ
jgi:anti-sigma regulatory factor (Ser/Thr protein kinase)